MQFNFDASTVAPNLGFVPLPAGKYTVAVASVEQKPTSQGGGAYLEIVWQVTQGEFVSRKLFDRLNLWNSSAQAVEMAYGTLSAILRATGKIRFQDTSEMVGLTCIAEISLDAGRVDKQTGQQYDPQNRIKAYHSPTGQPLTQIGGGPGAAQPWAQGAAGSAPPGFAPQQQQGPAPGFPQPGASAPPAFQAPGVPPQGFAPQQSGPMPGWAQGAPMQAPPPAANLPVIPAAPQPIKRITAKANGATMEWFQQNGWTEEAMIAQGYLEVVAPAPAAPLPPGPGAAPMQPPMPPQPGHGFAPPQAPGIPQQQWAAPPGASPVVPGAVMPGQPAPWQQR